MITVVYDDTMCNGPYRVEHKTNGRCGRVC